MRWRSAMAGCALLLAWKPVAAGDGTVRIAFSDAEGEPLIALTVTADRTRLTGGLTKDFGDLLSNELGMKPEYVGFSRKRLELGLAAGEIDMLCLYSPKWFSHPEDFDWSVNVRVQRDLVVAPRDKARQYRQADDLIGKRVGTIFGYRYPMLETVLEHGAIRVDERTAELSFRRLRMGTVDAIVVAEPRAANYFLQNPDANDLFAVAPLEAGRADTQCALSRRSGLSLGKINAAIAALKSSGKLGALLERYRFPAGQ